MVVDVIVSIDNDDALVRRPALKFTPSATFGEENATVDVGDDFIDDDVFLVVDIFLVDFVVVVELFLVDVGLWLDFSSDEPRPFEEVVVA